MAETLVADIESLIPGSNVPAYAALVIDLVGAALPKLFDLLSGQETAEEIAAPYLRRVFALGAQALEDAVQKKPVAVVRQQFDDALTDILEDLKVGVKA